MRASWTRRARKRWAFGRSRTCCAGWTPSGRREISHRNRLSIGHRARRPFLGTVEEDAARPGIPLVSIAQGGTLLPDRDYYLEENERFVRIRAQYVDYLTTIFTLAGRTGRIGCGSRARARERIARLPLDARNAARSGADGDQVLPRGARA